jgi:phosphotransacetylase
MIHKAQKSPKELFIPEGEEEKIIRAAHVVFEEKDCISCSDWK